MKKTLFNIRDITYIALFAAIIAVCSWISIPATVSFTMQTFAVFAAVGLLGTRRGTTAVAVYILIGCLGLPVFSGFRGGVGVLIGSTGGYIVGFLIASAVCGILIDVFGKGIVSLSLSMWAGLVLCYFFGSLWYLVAYVQSAVQTGFISILATCVLPFLPFDAAKIALAVFVTRKLGRFIKL